MEDYGTIESGIVEPPAAPSKKLRGRKMIAAVAALALVVVGAAVAAVSVSPHVLAVRARGQWSSAVVRVRPARGRRRAGGPARRLDRAVRETRPPPV